MESFSDSSESVPKASHVRYNCGVGVKWKMDVEAKSNKEMCYNYMATNYYSFFFRLGNQFPTKATCKNTFITQVTQEM